MYAWDEDGPTPPLNLTRQDKLSMWRTLGICAATAVLAFAGPVTVAVPLMAWWVGWYYANAGRVA
jgi:uncharacterized membrane protein